MDKKSLIVLIDLLVKDHLANIELPEGKEGPRGLRGRDAIFNLEDHRDEIVDLIRENTNIVLTEDQIELLKGKDGRDGKDGKSVLIEDIVPEIHSHIDSIKESLKLRFEDLSEDEKDSLRGKDGKDGTSIKMEDIIPEVHSHIDSIKESLKLKFEDLSEDEKESLRGLEGLEGKAGRDGKSVSIDEVSLEIQNHIESIKDSLVLKFENLTEEQKSSLKGADGIDGKDGRDGKDFDFESHKEEIYGKVNEFVSDIREAIKLKFEDLSEDEKESLRGPRGQRGKSGRDFIFEENKESISDILASHLESKIDELKLKFSDLSEDEVELLKGQDGKDGKNGRNFDFEDSRVEIQEIICGYIDSVRDNLKLYFQDLTEEEKNSLRFKFDDFTPDQLESLKVKGPRGQRGRPGIDGADGKDASTWLTGSGAPNNLEAKEKDLYFDVETCDIFKLEHGVWNKVSNIRGARGMVGASGLNGRNGFDGKDGRDGKDAPYIMEAKLENYKDEEFRIVFTMSNGEKIETNYIDFPAVVQNFYYSTGVISSGSGGSSAKTEYFDEGISLGTFSKVDFTGDGVSATVVGDKVLVTVNQSDTNTTELIVSDEGTEVVTTNKMNFVGSGVQVTDDAGEAVVTIMDTNTTELNVEKDGTLISTTDSINFTGTGVTVTEVGGKAVVNITGGGGSASIAIEDEGIEVTPTVQRMNFIGPYVTVRQRVPIAEWNPLSDVEPNLLDYQGDGSSDIVDIYVDVPDSSLLKGVNCDPTVFIGAFVYIDSSETARNALADDYDTSNVIGLVESITGTKCDIRVSGISSALFTGLNPSLDYFLSDTLAGQLSATVPTISGHIKLKLGQSFGSTKFLFQKGERVVRL